MASVWVSHERRWLKRASLLCRRLPLSTSRSIMPSAEADSAHSKTIAPPRRYEFERLELVVAMDETATRRKRDVNLKEGDFGAFKRVFSSLPLQEGGGLPVADGLHRAAQSDREEAFHPSFKCWTPRVYPLLWGEESVYLLLLRPCDTFRTPAVRRRRGSRNMLQRDNVWLQKVFYLRLRVECWCSDTDRCDLLATARI
jgi:hypothetical protein